MKYRDGIKKDCFIIDEPVAYRLSNGNLIIIPDGFETDFASIPRFLWNVFPPHWQPYRKASVIHDYLYMDKNIVTSRAFADMEFRRLLIKDGTNRYVALLFWLMVRIFGGKRFKRYKNGNR